MANQSITVQFSILQGQGVNQVNVYQENHTPTTDANGIIIVNIGEGTVVSGVFDDIDWASDDHFLNTQIDTGSGLVDMGTTGFKTVPYALSAKTAENVTGLEYIDDTNDAIDNGGIGKVDRVAANYGTMGFNAIDLSNSSLPSNVFGATGPNSTALGLQTEAANDASTAMGDGTKALGLVSTAMGRNTTAEGTYSTAMGFSTTAKATFNTAIGRNNLGFGDATAWIETDPIFEIGNGESTPSNALTVLKNGTITAPSFDISEITDNKALITKEYADANYMDLVFSGDYNDLINQPTIVAPTGLEYIDETNDAIDNGGLVRIGRNPSNYDVIGEFAVDLSYSENSSSTNGASDFASTAFGFATIASGRTATAMGNSTRASGAFSTAMGRFTIASRTSSTAMGQYTIASGIISTAMGLETKAEAFISTAIGYYNVGGGNPFSNIATDPLFEIGNGVDDTNRSNALTVLKNGTITAPGFDMSEITDAKALITKEYADANFSDTGIAPSGLETINEGNGDGLVKVGRTNANYGNIGDDAVDLSHSTSSSTTRGATGSWSTAMGLETIASGDDATAMGKQSIASGVHSTAAGLEAVASGLNSTAIGRVITAESYAQTTLGLYNVAVPPIGTTVWIPSDRLFVVGNGQSPSLRSDALVILKNGNAALAGSLTQNSDARLKKNIQPLENSLDKLLKLDGKNYYWNNLKPHSDGLQIGLIAQEVESIFPELVHTGSDGYKSVDYTSLVPVLIEATKSQQDIIDTQNERIKALEAQNKTLLSLEARLKALENNTNTTEVTTASN